MKSMYTLDEAKELVDTGATLMIAGDEKLLSQLPVGSWIGGTIPYFMTDEGGVKSRDKLFIERMPDVVNAVKIKTYTAEEIQHFPQDGFMTGYSLIIIPAFSEVHTVYANTAIKIPSIFDRPVVGWISGVDVEDVGIVTPKVFNGETGESFDDRAIVIHAAFKDNKIAFVDIINLFKPDNGDSIIFEEDGFEVEYAVVNGERKKFVDYLKAREIDVRVPMIANFNGAKITNSYREINENTGKVSFFAPVFKGMIYNQAIPIDDYEAEFAKQVGDKNIVRPIFSCNCVHNYMFANLEGKKSGVFKGPMTFGEIAYILLNRTLVYLTVD